MRSAIGTAAVCGLLLTAPFAAAQPPGGRDRGPRSNEGGDPVARMMAFDANKDGKLTKDEVTDARLHRLFDRADANKDGVVTKEELTALFAKEAVSSGGFGGGPAGGFGPPPRPGQILPGFLRSQLGLSEDQQKQLDALQKEADEKLTKILTTEQQEQLKDIQGRGPGGFGGGPGGGGSGGGGGGRRGSSEGGNPPPKQ